MCRIDRMIDKDRLKTIVLSILCKNQLNFYSSLSRIALNQVIINQKEFKLSGMVAKIWIKSIIARINWKGMIIWV